MEYTVLSTECGVLRILNFVILRRMEGKVKQEPQISPLIPIPRQSRHTPCFQSNGLGCLHTSPSLDLFVSKLHDLSDDALLNIHGLMPKGRVLIDPTAGRHALQRAAKVLAQTLL